MQYSHKKIIFLWSLIGLIICGLFTPMQYKHGIKNLDYNASIKSTYSEINQHSTIDGRYSINVSIIQHAMLAAPSGVSRVLLLATYRGGSTFLGQLFAQNSAAFYWYEPLQRLHKRKKDVQSLLTHIYPGHNKTSPKFVTELISYRRGILEATLRCDVTSLPPELLNAHVYIAPDKEDKMPGLSGYRDCLADNGTDCVRRILHTCLNATIVAVKTLRFPAINVTDMLQADPDLRVIYYTRDPRGIVSSRLALGLYHGIQHRAVEDGLRECRKYKMEVEHLLGLDAVYRMRIKLLRYEDLAMDVLGTAGDVYSFLGHSLPDDIVPWIQQHTTVSPGGENGKYGTRRNSTDAASRWRRTLDRAIIEEITKGCGDILTYLG